MREGLLLTTLLIAARGIAASADTRLSLGFYILGKRASNSINLDKTTKNGSNFPEGVYKWCPPGSSTDWKANCVLPFLKASSCSSRATCSGRSSAKHTLKRSESVRLSQG
jgi:hypothetical protein